MTGSGTKRRGTRPLADWVEGCIAPALGRFGFGEADIVSGWRDIAGARIAGIAEPLRLKWPRKGVEGHRPPATLVLRVDGAFAIELQHIAPALIERINAHVGWRCVGKLAFEQSPIERRPAPPRPSPPAAGAIRRAEALTREIGDDALRAALVRLGARALKPR